MKNNKKFKKNTKFANVKQRSSQMRLPTAIQEPLFNSNLARFNGYQPQNQLHGDEYKKIETLLTTNPTQAGIITLLTTIPQGIAVGQRTGDTVELEGGFSNWYAQVGLTVPLAAIREIIFQYMPNNLLGAPTLIEILTTASDITSTYNFQNSSNYRILRDRTIRLSGLSTAPTDSSNPGATGDIIHITSAKRTLQYNPAATTGSYQIYSLILSNDPTHIATFQTTYCFFFRN